MMVQGLAQLKRKLTATIPAKVETATRKAMEKGADELVGMMKRLVPVEDGDLRDSIGWTWGNAPKGSVVMAESAADSRGLKITVYAGNERTMVENSRGVRFQIARLQEHGTQAMEANPFFFPSWRALRKRIQSRIKREMKKAIKSESAQ